MANKLIRRVKNTFKKYLYIIRVWDKFTPAVQISQRQLLHYYQDKAQSGKVPPFPDTGFSVFSQHEEDGMLLFIFGVIGMKHRTFVEIGAHDGVNSNCANFAINFRWHGLFIDSDPVAVSRGKYFYKKYPDPWAYKPTFICAQVTRENINQLIRDGGFEGEIDLLSIDIDGNDYWIWEALSVIKPSVVLIEATVEFGFHDVVVPYDPAYTYPGKHPVYHGASPVAINKLAKRKGYRLVGSNHLGHNMFFVREDLANDLLPEVSVESTLRHPSATAGFRLFDDIRDWEYLPG